MLIRLETVGSCHYFRVTVPRTADVSPSWVALWASRINLLRFAQALLTTIAVVTLTIRYTFVARVLRAYTVFQKKFTLLLFAITKSDVDRFQ